MKTLSDQTYELVDALKDRLKCSTRRYELTLELAEAQRIALECEREDLAALIAEEANNE